MTNFRCLIVVLAILSAQQIYGQPRAANSQNKKPQSTPEAVAVVSPQPQPEANNAADTERRARDKERDDKDEAFKAEQLRQGEAMGTYTLLLTIFGGVSAFTAVVFAVIGFFQFQKMREQAASAAKQLDEMKDNRAEAKRQADTAVRSYEFTETSFYLAERAYLSLSNVEQIGSFSPAGDPVFRFDIQNGGRTPAFDVTVVVHTLMTEDAPENTEAGEWRRSVQRDAWHTIMPSEAFGEIRVENNTLPEGDLYGKWKFNQAFYYIKFEVRYWDIGKDEKWITYIFNFHKEHKAVICWMDTNVAPHRQRKAVYGDKGKQE